MIFFPWNILEKVVGMNDKYSEQQLKLRQKVLSLLLKKYDDNKSIYECADDWVKKSKTTAGLVKYYEAYYNTAK